VRLKDQYAADRYAEVTDGCPNPLAEVDHEIAPIRSRAAMASYWSSKPILPLSFHFERK
jgi:hypothetical protein